MTFATQEHAFKPTGAVAIGHFEMAGLPPTAIGSVKIRTTGASKVATIGGLDGAHLGHLGRVRHSRKAIAREGRVAVAVGCGARTTPRLIRSKK